MSLVPAETAAGKGLDVKIRNTLGPLFQSHFWKRLTEGRWQRHHTKAANVLWNQTTTEQPTLCPQLETFGADFSGICFFVLEFRAQPLQISAFPKKRNISLVTTKENLSSYRSSMTGRKKLPNYEWELCFHGHQASVVFPVPCRTAQLMHSSMQWQIKPLRVLESLLKLQYDKNWCFAPVTGHRKITSTPSKRRNAMVLKRTAEGSWFKTSGATAGMNQCN